MSHASNDARPSSSSQPSIADSSTLHSRRSTRSREPDREDASSVARPSASSRHSSADRLETSERQKSPSGQEREASKPNKKHRHVSGFLLGGFGTRKQDGGEVASQRQSERDKGKQKEESRRLPGKRTSSRRPQVDTKPMESSPLSQHVNGVDDEANGGLGISVSDQQHTTDGNGGVSGPSSDTGRHSWNASNGAGIDPTEIVHMALNLSESRRRNLSAGHLAIPPPTGSRRTTSMGIQPSVGGSLRQQLQQQRSISRNSPAFGRSSPPTGWRHSSASPSPASPFHEPSVMLQLGHGINIQPSAATISRAEKARRYIELSLEYKRLLQFLPRLDQDNSPNGRAIGGTVHAPGISNETPVGSGQPRDSWALGRAYNPLQYVRNRKLRNRERRLLHPDSDAFEDVERVHHWIDLVQERARNKSFHTPTGVALPPFADHSLDEDDDCEQNLARRRAATMTKAKRPRNDWSLVPADLLADAFWTEQSDHKTLMEDRNGNKIFKSTSASLRNQPRTSKELGRDERKRQSATEAIVITPADDDPSDSDESIRGRRQKKPSKEKRDSVSHFGKRRWGRGRSRGHSRSSSSSSSGLSSSDNEDTHHRRSRSWVGDNTGPLERQMKERMASEIHLEEPSPIISTPPRWDTAPEQAVAPTRPIIQPSERDADMPPQRASLEVPSFTRPRRQQTLLEQNRSPRSSLDESDYTAPNSPREGRPSLHSRKHSHTRIPLKPIVNFFKSESEKDRRGATGSDTQMDDSPNKQARQNTLNDESRPASPAPGVIKRFTHKSEGSTSDLPERPISRGNTDLKEGKDPNSTSSSMTRFFKAPQRIGEIVRTEGSKVGDLLWKRDPRSDDSDTSEQSDTDSSSSDSEKAGILRSKPRTTAGSFKPDRDSWKKPDYVLPTFVSSHDHQSQSATASTVDVAGDDRGDPQTRSRLRGKLGRLGTLKADFSVDSAPSSPDQSSSKMKNHSSFANGRSDSPSPARHISQRLTAVLDFPGAIGRGYPVTGLSGYEASGRPRPPAKRQWSITDQSPSRPRGNSTLEPDAVTKADLVRTRALLLSSGIKARELTRRANCPSEKLSSVVRSAASLVKEDTRWLRDVPRREEHIVVARLLSQSLDSSASRLRESLEAFPRQTEEPLARRLEKLRAQLQDGLAPKVHDCSDSADAFATELGGSLRLRGKKIADRVDLMARTRRRRMRWIRRVGWVLVEWAVLGFMWWLWFVVMIARIVTGTVGGVVKATRWLLWL
jgi:hypothetical protein